MKHLIVKFVIPVTLISLIMSCKPTIKAPTADKGSVDATRFVAIGNSITAGYADGALYYEVQQNSFVNLLAQQFKLIGGGDFKQPLMNAGSVGVGMDSLAPYKLAYSTDCKGVTALGPVRVATAGDVSAFNTSVYSSQGPFNNMGVPGAKAITVVQSGFGNSSLGVGNFNPFFYRMAANAATSSILSDAVAMNPTFFSVFIGNNDVLAYALKGASSDAITPTSGVSGVGFDGSINAIVNSLSANGAKGVIANIPDITSLPYFTTIPWNGLTLRAGQADSLNTALLGLFVFQEGKNAFIIEDTAVPFIGSRFIFPGELILLGVPLEKIKCNGMGTLTPIPAQYILTANEITTIQNTINAYNTAIKAIADAKGLAFVDVNSFIKSAQKGIEYNGISINMKFVTGGAFSLDGLHLNPIGQALLANEFIKAINSKFGSTIPQVDATKYRGIIFP